jgi:hypothetical protein
VLTFACLKRQRWYWRESKREEQKKKKKEKGEYRKQR